jgi:hypothetical protein
MLKAIHTQESRDAADKKAQAIVDDPRASKMGKAADLEQVVHETLTYLLWLSGHSLAEDQNQQSAGADHESDPALMKKGCLFAKRSMIM